ncbi:MAG: hypothetical protein Q9P01_11900 [Anaerolineae bacterium]|nr:hypothetical protein [Anaerolineae bacterium]
MLDNPIDQTVSNIPFNTPTDFDSASQRGMDIVLTIDRDIQYWVELELQRAVEEQGSNGWLNHCDGSTQWRDFGAGELSDI